MNSHTTEVIIYVAYCCVVITLGIMVNKKLYRNVKNEEHLEKGKIIQKIMKNHSLAQCVAWPVLILSAFGLKINKDILDILPHDMVGYIIIVIRCFNSFYATYGGFNSLVIAISRYICIVHEATLDRFGVKTLRHFMITSSFGIPVLFCILNEFLIPVEHVWGAYFMPNYTNSIDERGDNEINAEDNLQQSPLYLISLAYLPSSITLGLKFLRFIILILVYSNVLEGILYLHIYVWYHRSQNKAFLKNALSEEYRKRRHRRYTISIQMTVTSWLLEMISGSIVLLLNLFFSHHEIFNMITQILMFTHGFFYFVAIPGSYLLSTENSRNLIIEEGWANLLSFRNSHNRIAPSDNGEVEKNTVPENNRPNEKIRAPAPTITGNVNIETSFAVY